MAGLQNSGELLIEEAELITVDGSHHKVTPHVVVVVLFEDIENPTIMGQITFNDGLNLKDLAPLIGQESIKLKMRTPSMTHDGEVIQSMFYLHDLVNSVEVNRDNMVHSYRLISIETTVNHRVKLNRAFTGSISDMVKNIVRNDLKSSKDIFIEPSSGIHKIVSTDVSPFEFIRQITPQAISKKFGNPTYLFFENLDGFHFRSLESLYQEGNILSYSMNSDGGYTPKDKGKTDVLLDLSLIKKLSVGTSKNLLRDLDNGSFSSSVITHDIFNKKITHHPPYNYFDSFHKEKHINSFHNKRQAPIHSDVAVDDNGNRVSDYTVKNYLLPVSYSDMNTKTDSTATDVLGSSLNVRGYNPESWITKRTSLINNYDAISADIEVDGHTALRAGNIVEVNVPPKALQRQADKEKPDRFINGPFLVRNIEHKFVKEDEGEKMYHKMAMSCVKDCIEEKIVSTKLNPLPKVYGKSNKLNPRTVEVK